jgi:hypothetical protein
MLFFKWQRLCLGLARWGSANLLPSIISVAMVFFPSGTDSDHKLPYYYFLTTK